MRENKNMRENNIYLDHLKKLIEDKDFQYNTPLQKLGFHTIETNIDLTQFNIDAVTIIEEMSTLIIKTALASIVKNPNLFLSVGSTEFLFNRLLLDKKLPSNILIGEKLHEELLKIISNKAIVLEHGKILGKQYDIVPDLNSQSASLSGNVILYDKNYGIGGIDVHDLDFKGDKLTIQFSTKPLPSTLLISVSK